MRVSSALLAAYDAQLRREAEVLTATDVTLDGPLVRARFHHSGFVTYRDLGGHSGADLDALIDRTISYFRDETDVEDFEWKTRGHDVPGDLGGRLTAAGLRAEAEETVMVGEAALLAATADPPHGVSIRRLDPGSPGFVHDVRRMEGMQAAAFGPAAASDDLVARLTHPGGLCEAWVAEVGDEVVCAGRLEVVPGTEFAGLWGGATAEPWRGRGIYRALVAVRAGSAVRLGARYLQSDCTEMSRPILERAGLTRVTTTSPFVWRRDHSGG
ncbi:GNAT family N-acetyltransferase [Nocardioides piscis]|uniref:GNAT family N-acetyltransferase n=1 Tax=Nocardioides piscis TaxID=2714938 RepID=A0A6G7YI65_9ACTN|nr:GNAT family N-acetyltransferase [Nocardioides piscis]QIK76493.1 GNAT family N-acetyltransferase [Nocardioides piscis]